MAKNVQVISPDASLSDAAQKMTRCQIRRLVVTDKDAIVGMVSRRDLMNASPTGLNPFSVIAVTEGISTRVRSFMKHPVLTVEPDRPIEQAARLMTEHHIGCLPVTRSRTLVGIITESDIFRAFTEVLTEHPDSVRITFDLTESENVLSYLADATGRHGLNLLSFITFHEGNRRLAFAGVRGQKVQDFVTELWNSGHNVVSVLQASPAS